MCSPFFFLCSSCFPSLLLSLLVVFAMCFLIFFVLLAVLVAGSFGKQTASYQTCVAQNTLRKITKILLSGHPDKDLKLNDQKFEGGQAHGAHMHTFYRLHNLHPNIVSVSLPSRTSPVVGRWQRPLSRFVAWVRRPLYSLQKCQSQTDFFIGLLEKYHLHAEGLWPRASRGLNGSTADETWTRGLQLLLEGAEPDPRFQVRPGRRAPEAFRWWGDLCELASGSAVEAVPDGAVPPSWQA